MNAFPSSWTQRLAAVLRPLLPRRLLLLRPPPPPHLLPSLLAQVPRLRTVHQLHLLRHLGASWLEAPHLRLLDMALQHRLQEMAANPLPCPRSTSSSAKTARRTGKRRR